MLVKLKESLGSNDFPDHPFLQDEEHEVNATLGKLLVQRGLAVDITPAPEPIPVAPKQEPAADAAPATATKPKTSKEK